MNFKSLIYLPIMLFVFSIQAQDMQKGFRYLESGSYQEAESFFQNILIEYPKNKTARLCFGRAVGLKGNPEKAKSFFEELLTDHPNDFEVKLNYGESLLWNENFFEAKTYFESLIKENSKSFPALLSYANTLSNLKEYEDALTYVNKALDIIPGNPNALTSEKYIYLGYAYQKQQEQQYEEAERLLEKNLQLFNDDKDTLLNLANLYLIVENLESAEAIYNRLAEQPEHNIVALNGLALVAHLMGKENSALKISNEAFNILSDSTEIKVVNQTTERYAQALIWNKKYKPAKSIIDSLMVEHPNKNWVLTLRATLNIYKSNFKKSLEDYSRILQNDSTSFDGNLGKANVLRALGRYDEANKSAQTTLKFYKNQKDAVNFINILNRNVAPSIESKVAYTFDNGNNKAYNFNTSVVYPLSTKFSLLGSYNYRNTDNTISNKRAKANSISLGFAYQVLPKITLKSTAGLAFAKAIINDYSQLLTDLSININSFKLQSLEIGYKRQVESFNADLLDRELVQNNFYTNYNLSTNVNIGWFIQYMHTLQNDDNSRNLLFTSLYYNILTKPILKMGMNYQYITFKNQIPSIYFSPEKFNAGEIFVNVVKDETNSKPKSWFYNLTAAYGFQFIEDNPKQNAYRLQGAFGYKLSERGLLNIYGIHSNIASATAAGFTFTEIGLRFKWHILEKTELVKDQY